MSDHGYSQAYLVRPPSPGCILLYRHAARRHFLVPKRGSSKRVQRKFPRVSGVTGYRVQRLELGLTTLMHIIRSKTNTPSLQKWSRDVHSDAPVFSNWLGKSPSTARKAFDTGRATRDPRRLRDAVSLRAGSQTKNVSCATMRRQAPSWLCDLHGPLC